MANNVTKISVSADRMKSNHDDIKKMRNDLTVDSDEIMEIVDSMAEFWQGPAYETFRNSIINGLESFKGLASYMDSFLDAYAEANKQYKDTERKVYNYVHDL